MWTLNDMRLTSSALETALSKWNSLQTSTKQVTLVLVKLGGCGEAEHSADNLRGVDVPSCVTASTFSTDWAALVVNISAIMSGSRAFQCYPS